MLHAFCLPLDALEECVGCRLDKIFGKKLGRARKKVPRKDEDISSDLYVERIRLEKMELRLSLCDLYIFCSVILEKSFLHSGT